MLHVVEIYLATKPILMAFYNYEFQFFGVGNEMFVVYGSLQAKLAKCLTETFAT